MHCRRGGTLIAIRNPCRTGYAAFPFVAFDFLRGQEVSLLAGTWGNPVYALWAEPWLLQPVSLAGTYGLELLLLIGRLAAIIYYDLDFTDTARRMAQAGAQIVAVPSNDSVPFLAATHDTHLVFRAIENRVSLIKADQMRGAAAVDPWGRIVASVVDRNGRRSTLITDLPLGTHNSPLVYLGDWVDWLCLGGLTIRLIFSGGRRFLMHERRPR